MSERRRGSLLRLGLAVVLTCGMVPATALAVPKGANMETPPHRGFSNR